MGGRSVDKRVNWTPSAPPRSVAAPAEPNLPSNKAIQLLRSVQLIKQLLVKSYFQVTKDDDGLEGRAQLRLLISNDLLTPFGLCGSIISSLDFLCISLTLQDEGKPDGSLQVQVKL